MKNQRSTLKIPFVESFIGEYFMSMPRLARVVVYFILVLAFIHNYLKPTVLQGQLWIKDQSGKYIAGEHYELRHGTSAFRVNSDGRWMLTTGRKLPGNITVELVDAENKLVEYVPLNMPFPVWSAIRPKQYSIKGNREEGFDVMVSEEKGTSILPVAYALSQVLAQESNVAKKRWYAKINSIQVKESGDSKGHTGELYFKVYLNGAKLEKTGLPEKDYPNTHLLFGDNTTTVFKNLGFFLPESVDDAPESKLVIKIYDYDLFGQDDKVGQFTVVLNPNTEFNQPKTYDTQKLRRHWPNKNLSIVLEFQKKEF